MFDFLFNGGFMFILIIAGIAVFLNFVPLALWISAIAAGVNVGIFNLVGMRFRRVPASQIVLPLKLIRQVWTSMSISWKRIIWPAATLTVSSMR